MSNEVDLGLRIFLNDMLTSGLGAIKSGMAGLYSDIQNSANAAENFGVQMLAFSNKADEAGAAALGISTSMAQLESDFALNMAEVEGLNKDYDALIERQVEITTQLEALNASTSGFTNMTQTEAEQVSRLSTEFSTNNRALADNEAATLSLSNAMQAEQADLDALQVKFDAATSSQDLYSLSAANAAANMNAADAEALALSSSLDGVGVALGGGVALLLFGGALDFSTKSAESLQNAMAGVQITLNATNAQMNQMGQTITTVASNSIFSSTQVAQAFSMLGDRGASVEQIINGVGQASIDLAEAINSDAAPAADLLGKTMKVFNATTEQSTYYASALTFAFHNGLPSVSDLSSALNQTSGIAEELNIPINELVVTLDYLTQNGVTAGTAASSLRYMMQSLIDPTAKTNQELSDLGIITVNKVTPAFQAFEAKLASSGTTAYNLVGQFDGTVTGLQGLYNEAKKMGTLDTNETFNQWATSIGMVSNKLYDSKGNLNDWFTNLQTIGNSLKGKTQQDFNTALGNLFNVRSGQGGDVLLKNIDSTMKSIDGLNAKFKGFTGGDVPGVLKAAAERSDTLSGELNKLGTTFQTLGANAVQPLLQPLSTFVSYLNTLVGALGSGGPKFSSFASTFLLVGAALSPIAVIVGLVAAGVVLAGTVIGGALLTVLPIVGAVVGGIILVAAIAGIVVANWGPISTFFKNLFGTIGSSVGGFFSGVGTWVHNALDQLQKFGQWFANLDVVKDIWKGLSGGAKEFGDTLSHAGGVLSWIGTDVKHAWGDITQSFSQVKQALAQAFQPLQQAWVQVAPIVMPLLAQIGHGIAQVAQTVGTFLLPGLQMLGKIFLVVLGGTVAIAIGVIAGLFRGLIGIILSLVSAVGNILAGAFRIIAGVINVVSGVIHIIFGLFQAFFFLITGQSGKAGQAMQGVFQGFMQLGQGVVQIFHGLWSVVTGLWQATFGALIALVVGFVKGIIGFFQHLADTLVHHSIIPDMVNAIVGWIMQLPHRAMTMISQFVNAIISGASQLAGKFHDTVIQPIIDKVQSLISQMTALGGNIIKNLAGGIIANIANALGGAMNAATNFISSHLPHSPAKMGPLRELHNQGAEIPNQIALGIHSNVGVLGAAATRMGNVLSPQSFLHPNSGAFSAAGAGSGASTTVQFVMDSKVVSQAVIDHTTGQLKMNGIGRALK